MDEIGLVCEAFLDVINEFIFDKAFDKTRKLRKRLPFIILYVSILLSLIALLVFIGVNLVFDNNWFGYIFLLLSLLICFVLIYTFIFYKKRKK